MVPSPDAPETTLAASAGPVGLPPTMEAAIPASATGVPVPAGLPVAAQAGRIAYAQLAASDSEAAVVGEWERLRRQIGPLLRDRQQLTMAVEVAGRQVWRLRTGPFEQPREAEAFCAEVRAAGGKCWAATGS